MGPPPAATSPEADRALVGADPALWVSQPEPGAVAAAAVRVDGWVQDGARVEVRVAGRSLCPIAGPPLPDASARVGRPVSSWSLLVTLDAVPPGVAAVEVIARRDERTSRVVRHLTVDPVGAWRTAAGAAPGTDARPARPVRALARRAAGVPAPRRTPRHAGHAPPAVLLATPDGRPPAAPQAERVDVERLAAGDLTGLLRRVVEGPWTALVLQTGEGRLLPGAARELADAAVLHGAHAAYGDELWTVPGMPSARLKPAWSPELLRTDDLVGPVVALSRAGVRALLEAGVDGARTGRELLLRLDPRTARVAHALRPVVERSAPLELVVPLAAPPAPSAVTSIVVPTTHRGGHAAALLRSLADRRDIEVVLVDAGEDGRDASAALAGELGLRCRLVVRPPAERFNFSQACNAGAAAATGEDVLFLNDDIVVPTGTPWLERLRAVLHRPGVGLVGARLHLGDGRVQSCGVAAHPREPANIAHGWPGAARGPFGLLDATREVSALSGACTLATRGTLDALDGWDEGLALEFGDVDLGLRANALGLRAVTVGDVVVVHHESQTRGDEGHPPDRARFGARWTGPLAAGDPYWHPGLAARGVPEPGPEPAHARSRGVPYDGVAIQGWRSAMRARANDEESPMTDRMEWSVSR